MAQYSVDIVARALGGNQVDQLAKSFQGVEQAAAKSQRGIDGAANNIRGLKPAAQAAATGMQGLGAAIQAALGPILAVTTALSVLKKGIDTAFERGAAEQKLKNFTDSAGEYSAALAVAADSANKFGLSQTEATTALADVYSRLKGLGFGLKETSQIYQGFNSIALQSGTTAEDAAGAFLQLSQALGSGKLQGDELRAILERMPTLAQKIADSMGVSAAEIRNMGQEGKITSEVIYKALSQAAAEADNFGNKLNAQQSAMKNLKQVADQLLNSIGQVFAPFVIKGAELLAAVGQKLADWWGYLGNVIFPAVMKALEPLRAALANAFADIDFSVIIDVVQNILIKGMQLAIGYVANLAKGLAIVVNWFKELSNNSIIQGLVGAMGAIVEKLGLAGSGVKEWKAEQGKVTEEAAKSLESYSSMPGAVLDTAKAAKEVSNEVEKGRAAIDESLKMQQAYFGAQQAQLDLAKQRVEQEYEEATVVKDKIAAANQAHDLALQQAEAEYQASIRAVNAELDKARIAVQVNLLKEKEVEAAIKLAEAKGQETSALKEALIVQQQATAAASKALAVTHQIADANKAAAAAARDAAVAAADYARQQKVAAAITKDIERIISVVNRVQGEMNAEIDAGLRIVQARLQAEMAVNNVLRQQAERQLAAATNEEGRIRAAQAIYQLTVRQAQLELLSTKATIAAELEKAKIAVVAAEVKAKEVEAVVKLAIAQKAVTAAHFEALNAQRQAVGYAEQQLRVATAVAAEQNRAADATYKGKVAAAEAAYQQNVVAKNTQAAASAAGQFASNMSSGADAAERAAGALVRAAQGAKGVAPALAQFGEAGKNSEFANAWYEAMKGLNEKTLTAAASQRKYNETMAQFLKMAERYNQLKAQEKRSSAQEEWGKITGGRLPGYASGGYVTGPQVAMIGEGGQSEYVIPSSKMASAMANYAAGKRGSAVLDTPQVNITTGPVTQMDGTNYVTQGDLMASTQSAVKQTLALLQNNPAVRRSVGVAR